MLTKSYNLFLYCLLGSLVRMIYGYFIHPWNAAPDHLAWEMLLTNNFELGSFSYERLIHGSYEGGSILISIISLFIKLFTDYNSLIVAAFLLDFIVRLTQLFIVKRHFDYMTYHFFAFWTIFSLPSIIPWSTVACGSHYLSSIFPFLLLAIMKRKEHTALKLLIDGGLIGLFIWFNYINVVLIPIYLLHKLSLKNKLSTILLPISSLSTILILHLIIRTNFSAGFLLTNDSITSIRGLSFGFEWSQLLQVFDASYNTLAGSSLLQFQNPQIQYWLRVSWVLLVYCGILLFIWKIIKTTISKKDYLIFLTIPVFFLVYAISPFFIDSRDNNNWMTYRHFTYILPLLSLSVMIGFRTFNTVTKTLFNGVFLAFGIFGFIMTLIINPKQTPNLKAAGWIISNKLGHNPTMISSIISTSKYDKEALYFGIGWGLSSVLFKDAKKEAFEEKANRLNYLVKDFPVKYETDIKEGINFSFDPEITPFLDPKIKNYIKK